MRLTLRTLLAYLDDTLEPAQAKLIGQKVAESEMARELVERIKDVMRRRQQPAAPHGPGARLDPNTVAEYLDNVLTPEKLGEFEELLLHSDYHLGEVAGCHQILTLFLGQPAEVPALAKQRIYGLGKEQTAPARKLNRAAGRLPPEDEELLPTPPSLADALLTNPWFRRLAPVLGVLLLVALLGVAIWQIIPPRRSANSTEVAANDTGKDRPAITQPETSSTKPGEDPKKAPEDPKKAPEDPKKAPEDPGKGVAGKTDLAKPPQDLPSKDKRDLGKFPLPVGNAQPVFFRLQPGKEQWQRVAKDALISSNDTLLTLPGFKNTVSLDSGVQLTLFASYPFLESTLLLHAPATDFDVDCTLERGWIFLTNVKPQGPARIKVRFLNEIWQLILTEPGAEVAIQIQSLYPQDVPFSKKGDGEGPLFGVQAWSVKGESQLKVGYREMRFPSPCVYSWNSKEGPSPAPVPVPNLPDFLTGKVAPIPKEVQEGLTELAGGLGTKPVDIALAELRKEGKPFTRILSVHCLASIDALSDLVDVLGAPDDKDALLRDAAIDALRQWIARSPDSEQKLYQFLHQKKGYQTYQAEIVMELLHWFSQQARTEPETYEKLTENLRHPSKVAIRHLSWWHLVRMVPDGQKIAYNAGWPADAREKAFKAWRDLLPEGKVPPLPKPMPPK